MHPEGDFSYPYYRQLLHTARCHFTTHLLSAAPEVLFTIGAPALFIRHEVVVSPRKALSMAEIEYENGVSSTYFVKPDAPLYSLEERATRLLLWEILQFGHEIGLLFEINQEHLKPEATFQNIDSQIRASRLRLEQLINHKINVVSFHRYLPQLFDDHTLFAGGLVNADARELRHWYLCEDNGCWQDGEPIPQFAEPKNRVLQFSTHPFWWDEEHESAPIRLEKHFQAATSHLSPRAAATYDLHLARAIPGARRQGILELVEQSPEKSKRELVGQPGKGGRV